MNYGVSVSGSRKEAPSQLRCSFCHKEQSEVSKLIAGPDVFICNECVQCCVDIIRAEGEPAPAPADQSAPAVVTPSTHPTEVVRCRLCNQDLLRDEALEIPERGFLCPRCSGEVDVALAQKYGTGPISD